MGIRLAGTTQRSLPLPACEGKRRIEMPGILVPSDGNIRIQRKPSVALHIAAFFECFDAHSVPRIDFLDRRIRSA